MSLTCERCKNLGEPPPLAKVAFMGAQKARILSGICANCWREWEGVEIKVINEYRLNFMDPEHRETLKRACADFLGLGPAE
jgi:Fe-S cluster biosynthesis and repair protein YggX